MMRSSGRSLLVGLAWISPWLIGVAVFMAAPAMLSLFYSFTDYTLLEKPVYIGLDNYRELAGDSLFGKAIRNTLLFALAAPLGATIVSVLLAVVLEQRLRGSGLVRAIVFLPTLVPVVSACVCWLWLFNADYGLINSVLDLAGIDGPDWLGRRELAMPSLIFMSLWIVGSPLLVCSAALKEVPRELYEAADLDGATRMGRLLHVTLPAISPAVLFNAVMAVIWSIQFFAPPQIMTRGGPENSTLVYSMYVYANAFVYGRMGYASAMAWIQVLLTLMIAGAVLGLSKRFVYYRAGS